MIFGQICRFLIESVSFVHKKPNNFDTSSTIHFTTGISIQGTCLFYPLPLLEAKQISGIVIQNLPVPATFVNKAPFFTDVLGLSTPKHSKTSRQFPKSNEDQTKNNKTDPGQLLFSCRFFIGGLSQP